MKLHIEKVAYILHDGRCSGCGEPVVSIEDGKILIKIRIERIDPVTGNVQYKCRGCKQWLSSPFYKIVFDANIAVCPAS